MLASINIHMVSTTYLAPFASSTLEVISLCITCKHKLTTFVSFVSHPWNNNKLFKKNHNKIE